MYIVARDSPFARLAPALPAAHSAIYVDPFNLIPALPTTFASELNMAVIRYVHAVLNVTLVLFVTLLCMESVSYVSASNVTAVRVVPIDCAALCFTRHPILLQVEGVCQVAVVLLVAVRTCPLVGAVAALTSTIVVAL